MKNQVAPTKHRLSRHLCRAYAPMSYALVFGLMAMLMSPQTFAAPPRAVVVPYASATLMDTTAPTPGTVTAPGHVNTNSIALSYTNCADSGSGIQRVALWVKVGTGGAWADSNYSATFGILGVPNIISTSVSDTRTGWMWGAGVEYAFLPNWSAKIEYNYIDFRDENYNFPISILGVNPAVLSVTANSDVNQVLHLVKFGINYRFGGFFGKAPVVARY